MFFTDQQKMTALNNSVKNLKEGYSRSEKALISAAKRGDESLLFRYMNLHQLYEYALLFTYTPEFALLKKQKRSCYE